MAADDDDDSTSSSSIGVREEVRDPNWAARRATEFLRQHIPSHSSSSFSERQGDSNHQTTAIYSDDYVSAEEEEWDEEEDLHHDDEEDKRVPESEWDRAVSTGTSTVARSSKDFFSTIPTAFSTDSTASLAPRTPKASLSQKNFLTPLAPSDNNTFGSSSSGTPPYGSEEEEDDMGLDLDNSGESFMEGGRSDDEDSEAEAMDIFPIPSHPKATGRGKPDDEMVAAARHAPTSPPRQQKQQPQQHFAFAGEESEVEDGDLSAGVLPDVLMNMRQKLESLAMFDSDMMRLAASQVAGEDPSAIESREALKRSSQQSISASVLASLAHKRYERRRLAAMEIEKVIRSLVLLHQQTHKNELERVRAILLLLSDDYVRSTNEDARKGGVVALAACAIGLKKADDQDLIILECRDLILASVIHACQDHSKRVRYYATESLFNVVKVIPSLAVEHFFILYEVLRSLFGHVDPEIRSGAETLDKKLKEVIVGAINAGVFSVDACVLVFARFVYVRNNATKRLTLSWLQELNEKLIGAPILEFLHMFLGGVIDMVASPSLAIRQSALAFLQSVLPKLLVVNSEKAIDDDLGLNVDYDKILQSLVTTMEHANPSVRKVAVYWMAKIVKAHMKEDSSIHPEDPGRLSAASVSVRNSVPHVLPGILLSIGDNFVSMNNGTTKDTFLPDQTTQSLAEQTNACLQEAVRRDGVAFVEHLDGFIVALREEMATPGGFSSRNPRAVERTPYVFRFMVLYSSPFSSYRIDIPQDGTGIERPGFFRTTKDAEVNTEEAMVASRLCALHWVIVLYESVVPDKLKADYAREFIFPIIRQLADKPPETIVCKSLDVLAKITVPTQGEERPPTAASNPLAGVTNAENEEAQEFPLTPTSVAYAMHILDDDRWRLRSRDNDVFAALIQLHSDHEELVADLSKVITYMCKLQPPEFVMVSFAVELDRFVLRRKAERKETSQTKPSQGLARDLRFVSSFVQHVNHVLLNMEEAADVRKVLKDCIAIRDDTEPHHQKSRLFYILLYSFSHNIASTLSLCLWAGAYKTAYMLLNFLDPLDISLVSLLEIDRVVELLERPLFRHIHVRMLEREQKTSEEGSGVMLFQLLKSLLMVLPQSTCYRVLRDRLVSVSRFRQSTISHPLKIAMPEKRRKLLSQETKSFVERVLSTRRLHCQAAWQMIRQESLETPTLVSDNNSPSFEPGARRRSWLGYQSKEEQDRAYKTHQQMKERHRKAREFRKAKRSPSRARFEGLKSDATKSAPSHGVAKPIESIVGTANDAVDKPNEEETETWKEFWDSTNPE